MGFIKKKVMPGLRLQFVDDEARLVVAWISKWRLPRWGFEVAPPVFGTGTIK